MKNLIVTCMAACLILSCSTAKAQTTDSGLKEKYERETLMLEGNKDQYSKNNEWQKIGIFGAGLEKEFTESSPESKDELKTFRKRRKRGVILLIAGGAVFVSAAVVAPYITLPVFFGTFGAGMGTYSIGAFDLNKSRRHLNKAIWLRNRDLLVKQ